MSIIGVTGQTGSGKDEVAGHIKSRYVYIHTALADPIKRFGLHVFGFDKNQLWGPSSARNAVDPRFKTCNIRSSGVEFNKKCSTRTLRKVCDEGWAKAAENLLSYGPIWLEDLYPEGNQEELMSSLCFWFQTLGHKYPELSPRIMLQHLGTEWGRYTVDDNLWINYLLKVSSQILEGYFYNKEEGIIKVDLEEIGLNSYRGVVVSDVRFTNELQLIQQNGGKVVKVVRPETDDKSSSVGIGTHPSEEEQKQFSEDMFDGVLYNTGTLNELYEKVDQFMRNKNNE